MENFAWRVGADGGWIRWLTAAAAERCWTAVRRTAAGRGRAAAALHRAVSGFIGAA